MGNKLFQQAREAVQQAETTTNAMMGEAEYGNATSKIEIAKNNLSSAFANSTNAEKEQLQALQQRLEECDTTINTDNKYL
jgi:exonuclease VII large subunit